MYAAPHLLISKHTNTHTFAASLLNLFCRIPASSAVADSEVKVHVEVSFMFEQETIHLGAIELLRECFWSSKKKNKPIPRKLSCMHRAPYQEHTELYCFYLQPPAISEGESL
ncbi:hypothetical protein P8452_65328 [Trifolium repens]|nr:hypothetical protein P8452_65328 [Trifolium repens]